MEEYTGKPLAYLDHNIFDRFVKNDRKELEARLFEDYQVVYSDENLNEIHRSGNFAPKFLNVLERLNAAYIKNELTYPGFIDTGRITIDIVDPAQAFNEYLSTIEDYNGIQKAIQQNIYKFYGGRKGESISIINAELVSQFQKLMSESFIGIDINELKEVDKKTFENLVGTITNGFEEIVKQGENAIKDQVEDDSNWNPISDFRLEMKLSAQQLNNIEPPNVFEKIWNLYKEKEPYNEGYSIEKFFGIDRNPIYPNREYFTHQKVTAAYNMLNTVGYYSDSKTHLENKFISFMSDNLHASMACFCDALFSGDERLAKKAYAIYEYLKIGIRVEYVLPTKN